MKEIEAIKDSAIKEGIDLAVGYTKQFVEALTPVAKQAYEVGLVTLQVDAVQSIVWALLVLAICTAWLLFAIKKERGYESSYFDTWHENYVIPIFISGGVLVATVFVAFHLLNVWTWTKLIKPELWLAHQAIEKIVK